MKRKNKLKSLVDCCFVCGKQLNDLKDKVGHRINPKKGNTKNNLLVVCEKCKKLLQKISLGDIKPQANIVDKYFKNLGIDCKKVILQKLYNLRITSRTAYKDICDRMK